MDFRTREAKLRYLETTLPSSNWASLVLSGHQLPDFKICTQCKHLCPPIYIENGVCYDCYIGNLKPYRQAMLPPSRSIIRGV